MSSRFSFRDRTVYILSPEKWGNMRISKHHYALELARAGARVYFIEPPDLRVSDVEMEQTAESAQLRIVRYKPVFRGRRFLPAWLYNLLIRLQISKLKKAIDHYPDIVWCFDANRFRNLQWFGARHSIFFGADLFPDRKVSGEAKTAEICLGISDTIVQSMQGHVKAPVYFLNHGLSATFVEPAQKRLASLKGGALPGRSVSDIRVGYVGSLVHEALDRKTMRSVISQHPELRFVFWGQYERKGNFVAFESEEVFSFIDFLKAQPNVELRGAVSTTQLSFEIQEMDLFWLCWDLQKGGMWDGSNSHKVLEYLSTGRPVVSHYMSTYKGKDILDILTNTNPDGYAELFDAVCERIRAGESPEAQMGRIEFALQNSYYCHIKSIENILSLQEETKLEA
jgi:hypothetical protein